MSKDLELIKNSFGLQSTLFGFDVNYVSDSDVNEGGIYPTLLRYFRAVNKSVNYTVFENVFLVGYIACDGGAVIIGPAITEVADLSKARKLIGAFRYGNSDITQSADYIIDNAKAVSINTFITAMCLVYSTVFDKVITPDRIIGESKLETEQKSRSKKVLNEEKRQTYFGGEYSDTYNIENTIAMYVTKGDTENLLNFLFSIKYIDVKLGNDSLRHFKNATVILNNVMYRAAIESGVSKVMCYRLGEINLQQIEACNSLEALNVVAISFAKEYCEQVAKVKRRITQFDDINTVMQYIEENVHNRIKVSEIAKVVFLSPEYLSVKFHRAVGETIPSYINRVKIEKAKELLVQSDMPIGEISEYLAFSSQSYFQNIFKKYCAVTPKEYREKDGKNIKGIQK